MSSGASIWAAKLIDKGIGNLYNNKYSKQQNV